MAKREIGQEILYGIREVKEYKAGKETLGLRTLKAPSKAKTCSDYL